jgi:peptidoglycan/LPS O-acetylase OafA/YrhL
LLALKRITSTGRFVPEIDGLRFAAIASVVLYHFQGFIVAAYRAPVGGDVLRTMAEHGYRGVNVFYVISGFVLGLPFAAHRLKGDPPVRLSAYFLRRLTRLEPPYILNLLVCFAVAVFGGARFQTLLPHLCASLLYLHNLCFGEHSVINPVAWTLEVEVQFYCAVPLLASIFCLKPKFARRILLVAAILGAGILQRLYWDAPQRVQLTILFAIQFFLAGFLLADLYICDWSRPLTGSWRWDAFSLIGWPLLFLPGDRRVWIWLPFLVVALCAAVFRGAIVRRVFTLEAITIIGGMCYSIYLFHYVLIPGVLGLSGRVGLGGSFARYFFTQSLFYVPVLLLIAGAYFVLVERPCMRKDWPLRALRALRGR